ncbi:flagellar hook assembly protein FlgD [Longimicrobium sp.]|uniref:flagellar hook assembly protein FlgD n=1 Tax=Longimicrobium sp. TaxID=2029185 RepID=UPI002E380175|nr:flagellar hook capping FlgD N-terminal domain-containing protein [Longimicrobium sp.]HEX6039116.1 flagellar hook capping FlgD N-terminal domain-containing protein [Longimicrobium sp.]
MISSVQGAQASTPSSAFSNAVSGPGGKLGKEEFLRLLVTQMQNQDPMNPMQGEEFAAQLAQFSSLEQLIGIGTQLSSQAEMAQLALSGINAQNAMGTLGRQVTAQGDDVRISENGQASVTFEVGAGGGNATVRIYDEKGREVGSRELGAVQAGRQTVELGSAAEHLPAGNYTYKVEVTDAAGAAVPVQTYTIATIDGVRYGQEGPVLLSNGIEIPLQYVVAVESK